MSISPNKTPDFDKSGSEDNPWLKMANTVLNETAANEAETIEKTFYETNTEFTPENIKEFRETLLFADPETTKQIIENRITFLEENAEKVSRISPDRLDEHIHRGYIGSQTKVQFEGGMVTMGSSYNLKDTAYLHEAVQHLQANKESIKNGAHLFSSIEGFLNSYFGIPDTSAGDSRMSVIDRKADLLNPDLDDDEYFARIDNIDISIFKNEHAAQCTERSAMAQNIMSLFGYETYYTNGSVNIDGSSEYHAYNIVANNSGQKCIIDYSVTSTMEYHGTHWLVPTQIGIRDFNAFTNGQSIKSVSYDGRIDDDGKVTRTPAHALIYTAMK